MPQSNNYDIKLFNAQQRSVPNRIRSIIADHIRLHILLLKLKNIIEHSNKLTDTNRCFSLLCFANRRCGEWYLPAQSCFREGDRTSSVYFKSADGHYGNWKFNETRTNLHVLKQCSEHIEKEGSIPIIVVVDATQHGKEYSDSLLKTIPIWANVVNSVFLKDIKDVDFSPQDNFKSNSIIENEINSIVELLPQFEKSLIKISDINFSIEGKSIELKYPIRCFHVATNCTEEKNNERLTDILKTACISSAPFIPLICLCASGDISVSDVIIRENAEVENRTSFTYVPGAADDEESWARGLKSDMLYDNIFTLFGLKTESRGTYNDFMSSVLLSEGSNIFLNKQFFSSLLYSTFYSEDISNIIDQIVATHGAVDRPNGNLTVKQRKELRIQNLCCEIPVNNCKYEFEGAVDPEDAGTQPAICEETSTFVHCKETMFWRVQKYPLFVSVMSNEEKLLPSPEGTKPALVIHLEPCVSQNLIGRSEHGVFIINSIRNGVIDLSCIYRFTKCKYGLAPMLYYILTIVSAVLHLDKLNTVFISVPNKYLLGEAVAVVTALVSLSFARIGRDEFHPVSIPTETVEYLRKIITSADATNENKPSNLNFLYEQDCIKSNKDGVFVSVTRGLQVDLCSEFEQFFKECEGVVGNIIRDAASQEKNERVLSKPLIRACEQACASCISGCPLPSRHAMQQINIYFFTIDDINSCRY